MVKRCFKVPVVIFDGNVDQQHDANDAQNADPGGAVGESDLGHVVLCGGCGGTERSDMSPVHGDEYLYAHCLTCCKASPLTPKE